jgi:hypothetical protein
MPESSLDPYRDEILSLHRSGYSQADIRRRLEAAHGLTIGRTSVSDFLKPFKHDTAPMVMETRPLTAIAEVEPTMLAPGARLAQDMNALCKLVEILGAQMTGMTEKMEAFEQSATSRHTQTHGKIDVLARGGLPPALYRRMWRNALLLTGGFWALLVTVWRLWF